MGNNSSKPGGPIRVLSKKVVTDIKGEKFITLRLEDYVCPVGTQASIRQQIKAGRCFIPYHSSEALRQVSTASPATEEQCKNRVYGIATGIYMNNGADTHYEITCQLYLPNIMARLAMGSNPPGICTAALKKLRKLGNGFRHPQECPPKTPEDNDESLCVVCMEYEPRFWWSECESEHRGKFPLICHRCCNNLRRRAAQGKSIRGAPAPTLPCFICQKLGRLISQTSGGGAVARMKETKMPPPTESSKSARNKATQLPTGERSNINTKQNV